MDATVALMAALRALAEQHAFNDALRQRIADLEAQINAKEVDGHANPDAVR